MTDTRNWTSRELPAGSSPRRGVDRAFALYRALILVYGGFLLGMLTRAWQVGDQFVFWPWALVFLLMLVGFVTWQRLRSAAPRQTSRSD